MRISLRPVVGLLVVLVLTGHSRAEDTSKPLLLAGRIDKEIDRALGEAKVPASPMADDAEFLRRIFLDLTGQLPGSARAITFLDSIDPEKRSKLIDELLDNPAYGARFAAYWTELFIKRNDANPRRDTTPFRKWMAERFNTNTGWDKIVRELITASGNDPQTLFMLTTAEKDISPTRATGTVGALFLGTQLQCAECHRHPVIKDWKREDYWGVAAFFSRTRLDREKGKPSKGILDVDESPRAYVPRGDPKKPAPSPGERLPAGVLEIPSATDGTKMVGQVKAKFLQGDEAVLPEEGSFREPLAVWVTSRDNRWFASAAVNRMWAYFFARGFVNPIDNMTPENKPSHPAVLELLSSEFIQSGFDQKQLIRSICNTKAYQRTSRTVPGNGDDQALFSRMPVKAISGPTLLVLLEQILGKAPPEKSPGGPKNAPRPKNTAELFDTAGYDETPDEYTSGVPQALRLLNTVLPERTALRGTQLARGNEGREKIVEQLYLTTLSRRPRSDELKTVLSFLEKQSDPAKAYASLLWILIACPEFVSNH